ncbi:MAG: ANTAR domain-containing protein [Gammaproteobacteria bacterium]|nr:ANTAR domain-containing protein [Gammaproteobacteria bacterium]
MIAHDGGTGPGTAGMQVMLVDESSKRAVFLEHALLDAGYRVVCCAGAGGDLSAQVREHQPDVIIIDTESPDRDTLEHLCCISRDQPRPVVIFTHDEDSAKIRAAMQAGVSAYVVRGLASERIKPVIDVAIARFREYQILKRDLEKANANLTERKLIERAKGIVMRQRGCTEDEAYRALRKLAMDRGKRLLDVAQVIVAAEELLTQV